MTSNPPSLADRSRAPRANKSGPALPCDSCAVRSLNLCQPLDNQRLFQLLQMGGMRRWKKREVLFRAGDPITSFFKIRKGIVAVSRNLTDGRRQIVALRGPGDCVGYLDNDGAYAFEGEALTEVTACAFDRRQFDAYAAQQPDLAAALSKTLSGALRQAAETMTVLGKLSALERVANFLADLSDAYNKGPAAAETVTLHMGRRAMADLLGLSIETVSRVLTKLKALEVIALVGVDKVVILDSAKLHALGKV